MQKGYSVMQGYCNDPEQTAEVVIDDWMHTGDLAVIDEPGYHRYSWIIITLVSSCKADDISSFCHNQITRFKVPHDFEFVTEIPMTVTGKPQKYLMREELVRLYAHMLGTLGVQLRRGDLGWTLWQRSKASPGHDQDRNLEGLSLPNLFLISNTYKLYT